MIEEILIKKTVAALEKLYDQNVDKQLIQIQKTKKEFEGDLTIVVFPLLRFSRKKPEQTANEIGEYLQNNLEEIQKFNVVKGFLNLVISDKFWLNFFLQNQNKKKYGYSEKGKDESIVIEFSSPNTNKPLHLGHIRNNLVGNSIANILKASGRKVQKVNLVNDRGIHICKSMLAWQMWGNNQTPEISNMKGDKFVGDFYVKFEKENKKETAILIERGVEKDKVAQQTPLMEKARKMLVNWESCEKETRELWEKMNNWVYKGFDKTYNRLGINFDKTYYESETYLLGKEIVLNGLKEGILFKKDDGSVWADLSNQKLDEKLLLRPDGTSVYITQDIGTAQLRHDDYNADKLLYVVGNEQIYHFNVLKIILEKLGREWAENIIHIAYGMVELPHGKMKSREGTVVDADDLMNEMQQTAKSTTEELGKIEGFSAAEANELFETIGQGALKYFILKVDPKKNMLFNPVESIDFTGNTGPFIQYTYARINSLIRKAEEKNITLSNNIPGNINIHPKEKQLIKNLYSFPETIQQAAEIYSPALIANYAFNLVKDYNQFYQEISILREENFDLLNFRLKLSEFTGKVIKTSMELLGIKVPERM
ncbi:MAG: arginine--tRNA ligase [Bacteroidales bacterium]|nr:arginine--tRNA ligase [Bacteroidales bacterium]